MKINSLVSNASAFVTLILFIFLASCESTTNEPEDVSDEITSANEAFMAAYNSGNVADLEIRYTKDARLYPPNSGEIQGTLEISEYWQSAMEDGLDKIELQTLSAQKVGNSVNEIGKYKLFSEGGQLVDEGKYIVIWEKEGDEWKLKEDIWNSSMPVPIIEAEEPSDSLNL